MSKIIAKNSKDQNFEDHKGKFYSVLERRALKMFEHKHFHDEFKPLFVLATVFLFASSVGSFFTCQAAFSDLCSANLGSTMANVISTLLFISVELAKGLFWGYFVIRFLEFKRVSSPILFWIILLHFVSVSGSAYGGYILPSKVDKPEAEVIPKIEEDKIKKPFIAAIAVIDAQLKENNQKAQKITSNSTLRTFNANNSLLLAQKTAEVQAMGKALDEVKEKYQKDVEKAEAKNIEAIQKHNEDIKLYSWSGFFAGIIFEFIIIAACSFNCYYYFRLNIDARAAENETDETSHQNNAFNASHSPQSSRQGDSQEPQKAPEVATSEHGDNELAVEASEATTPQRRLIRFVQYGSSLDDKNNSTDNTEKSRLDGEKTPKDGDESPCLDGKETSKDVNSSCLDGKLKECELEGCTNTFKPRGNKKYCCDRCRKQGWNNKKYNEAVSTKS